jgi:hypothetical protein
VIRSNIFVGQAVTGGIMTVYLIERNMLVKELQFDLWKDVYNEYLIDI